MQLRDFWRKLRDIGERGDRYIVIDEDGDPQFLITPFDDADDDEEWFLQRADHWDDESVRERGVSSPTADDDEKNVPVRQSTEKVEKKNEKGFTQWDAMIEAVGPYHVSEESAEQSAEAAVEDEPVFQFEAVDDERV